MSYLALIMILLYYLAFMIYYQRMFPARSIKHLYALLSLAVVAASYPFFDTQNLCGVRFPVVLVVMIAGIRFSTSMNWLQAVYGGNMCVLSAFCSRGIFIAVGSLIFQGHAFFPDTNKYYGMTILSLILALLIFFIMGRTVFLDGKLKRFLDNTSQLRLIVALEMMAAANLIQINFGRDLFPYDTWYMGTYLSSHGRWSAKIAIGICLLTLCTLFYAVYQSIQSTELLEYRCRTKKLEDQYEQQLRHYKSYQKYTESFRAFKHDYKSMMVSLKGLLRAQENQKAIQLIDDIYDDMQKRVEVHKKYSDNVILDAMLQDIANICEEKEIRFLFNTSAPRNTGLSRLDAIRVFSNITQNAIEACEKVPVEERFLHIATKNDDQWVTFEAVNSYDGKFIIDKGTVITTKLDKKGHGLGLGIVREIAQNLGGFVIYDADAERKEFLIRVHVPCLVQIE